MQKKYYQHHFKDKKITVMGLGLLGRGIQVTEFLAKNGAKLTVTDLKSKQELAPALKKLSKYNTIRYVLGSHNISDFENVDMVVKAAGVPLDSPYILYAKKKGVDVVMDASLFVRLAPRVIVVGVTGTRGKSMTASAIYHILQKNEKKLGCSVYSGGNLRGKATLPLLAKVQDNDIVVLELDSWQCQGFGDEKISPHIAVFTNFMTDHMNYYRNSLKKYFNDKVNIFRYQTEDDLLVIGASLKKEIQKKDAVGRRVVVNKKIVAQWKMNVVGEHQRENIAFAVEVTKSLGVSLFDIKKAVHSFPGVEGRLQYVKSVRGVKIYNDNNATTPEATTAGLVAVATKKTKKIILIAGGNDKNIPLGELVRAIKKNTKVVFLTPGNGTNRLVNECQAKKVAVFLVRDIAHGVHEALRVAKKGDFILFSPAFTSYGEFANEYERNDAFVKIVKKL